MSTKNPLTLVSPQWAKKIEDGNLEPEGMLTLDRPRFCVVGEAYRGLFDWDDCKTCDDYSMKIFRASGQSSASQEGLTHEQHLEAVREAANEFALHFLSTHKLEVQS